MKQLKYKSIQIDGVDTKDWPDFCDAYVTYAEWSDGTPLTDAELDELNDKHPELAQEFAYETVF